MAPSSVVARSLALAIAGAACMAGALPAVAQSAPGRVVVTPDAPGGAPVAVAPPSGANLPPPPPGALESRITAPAELGGTDANSSLPPSTAAAPSFAVAPAYAPQPAYTPPPAGNAPAYTPPPATAAAPSYAAPAYSAAPAAPLPPEPPPAPALGPLAAAVVFMPRSAELSDIGKAELERIAKLVKEKNLREIQLRAYATGTDPESRMVSLARALIVRSYLIDQRVKARIEVGTYAGEGGDRVDILVPSS